MSFARIVPNPIIPNRLDLLNNGDLPRDMVGITITAKRRPALTKQKSEITLDSHLRQDGGRDPLGQRGDSSIDNYEDYDSPEDMLAFKIKVAELQTEIQAQQVRVSKYQALLSQVQSEYLAFKKENNEIMKSKKLLINAVDCLKDQLALVKRENTELKKMMKTMFYAKRVSECMSIESNEQNGSFKLNISGSANENNCAFSDSGSTLVDLFENASATSPKHGENERSYRRGNADDILVTSSFSMGTLDVEFQTSETSLEKVLSCENTLSDDLDLKFKPKSNAKRSVNDRTDQRSPRNSIIRNAEENNHDCSFGLGKKERLQEIQKPTRRMDDFPQQQVAQSSGTLSRFVRNMSWNLTTATNVLSNNQIAADVNNMAYSSVEDVG